MTGCGEALTTDVKITSATKANCTIQVGFDDELLSAIAEMSGTTTKDLIKEMKASGATYSKKEAEWCQVSYVFYIHKKCKTERC